MLSKLPRILLPAFALALLLSSPPQPPPDALTASQDGPAVQLIPPPSTPSAVELDPLTPPENANVIENCTVTWYTEDTCGKTSDHPACGVTASGLPVVEHLTCAVDPDVIPLFSDVYVQFADGSVERFQATDTGVGGAWVDIYTPDYDYAIQCGLQSLTVYWVEPKE